MRMNLWNATEVVPAVLICEEEDSMGQTLVKCDRESHVDES